MQSNVEVGVQHALVRNLRKKETAEPLVGILKPCRASRDPYESGFPVSYYESSAFCRRPGTVPQTSAQFLQRLPSRTSSVHKVGVLPSAISSLSDFFPQ